MHMDSSSHRYLHSSNLQLLAMQYENVDAPQYALVKNVIFRLCVTTFVTLLSHRSYSCLPTTKYVHVGLLCTYFLATVTCVFGIWVRQ